MPDLGPLGQQAAFFMQELEQDYDGRYELGDVLIVAEVTDPDTGETTLAHSCSSERAVVALGMAELLGDSLRTGRREDGDG